MSLTPTLRFCGPRCSNRVPFGRCPLHGGRQGRDRRSSRERGYGKRWEHASKAFRNRYPLCGQRPNGQRPVMSVCFDRGLVRSARQVDHVIPHRGDERLFWDREGNWQSLCASCGSKKSRAGL
jgi:5-methylcytosine-specific restriction protein A